MTRGRPWPHELTKLTGKQVQRYRKERDMTAEQLAAAVTKLGLRYTRSQVTNLEAGRRDTVTVGEVFVLGAALGAPPLLLLFPLGRVEQLEPVPGIEVSPWDALLWAEHGLLSLDVPEREVSSTDHRLVEWFRRHADLVRTWAQASAEDRRARHLLELPEDAPSRRGRHRDEILAEADGWERTRWQAVDGLRSVRELLRRAGLVPPPLTPALQFIDEEHAP